MPRYRADENLPYFCTITVLDWLPVFIEGRYIDPLLDCFRFCRANKRLQLFAYVVMPNHLHFIAAGEQLHGVMRDFKRFTSRSVHDLMKADGRDSLLDWMAHSTQHARQKRNELGLWADGFHPIEIRSRSVYEQKLRYLHENPVRKGLVRTPADWYYSSARFHESGDAEPLELDVLEL